MRKLMFISFIALSSFAMGQDATQRENPLIVNADRTPLTLSYYGNLGVHPGFRASFDWNLWMLSKTKEKRKRSKTIHKLLYVSPNIAFYAHKSSHQALNIGADIGFRRYSKRFIYGEVAMGLGYQRRFNANETWVVNNGNVSRKKGSRGYFSPSLSFGLGRTFNTPTPFSIFGRLNTNLLVGYNATTVPEISTEIGIRIQPKFGIKRKAVQLKSK